MNAILPRIKSEAIAMKIVPENLRLAIEAPGADRAAITAALQAAEEQLASRGVTLQQCYSVLAGNADASPSHRLALDAAGLAALSTLQDRRVPAPPSPCLVLVARY